MNEVPARVLALVSLIYLGFDKGKKGRIGHRDWANDCQNFNAQTPKTYSALLCEEWARRALLFPEARWLLAIDVRKSVL